MISSLEIKLFAMKPRMERCCTSPATLCYWFVVSLLAWGLLSIMGIYWHPLRVPWAACFFAMAIGCLANWVRNHSLHCVVTGPLFLVAGVAFLLSGIGAIRLNAGWVWPFIMAGVSIAFLLEWLCTKRPA
jgi:hypothetical protein